MAFNWPKQVYRSFRDRGIDPDCVQPTYDMGQITPGGEVSPVTAGSEMPYIFDGSEFVLLGVCTFQSSHYTEIGVVRPDGGLEVVRHNTPDFGPDEIGRAVFEAPEGHVVYAFVRSLAADPKRAYARLTVARTVPADIFPDAFNSVRDEYLTLIDGYSGDGDGAGAHFPHGGPRGPRTNEAGSVDARPGEVSSGNLSFSLPDNSLARIRAITAEYTTSAVAGDRAINLQIDGDFWFGSPVVQPPSTTYRYIWAVGLGAPYESEAFGVTRDALVHVPIPQIPIEFGGGFDPIQVQVANADGGDSWDFSFITFERWHYLHDTIF